MSSPAIWDAAKASASWESELAAWDCITDLSCLLKAFLILFVYLAIVGACTHCCSLGWAAHHCYKECRRNTDHVLALQQEGQQGLPSPRSSSPPSARDHNRQATKLSRGDTPPRPFPVPLLQPQAVRRTRQGQGGEITANVRETATEDGGSGSPASRNQITNSGYQERNDILPVLGWPSASGI